jgi:hypothetical protein
VGIVRLNSLATRMKLTMATSSIIFSMEGLLHKGSNSGSLPMRFCLSHDE